MRTLSLLSAALAAAVVACAPIQKWQIEQPPQSVPPRDFDVVWQPGSLDPNGAPLNPSWATQRINPMFLPPQSSLCQGTTAPFSTACTSQQPSIDSARGIHQIVCGLEPGDFHGHANWLVATLTGYSSWSDWAPDDDMNFYFVPDDALGGVAAANDTIPGGNSRYIELEFAHAETFALFGTGWWTHLAALIDDWANSTIDASAINAALNEAHPGRMVRTSVFGLFGLDCEHGCKSEVHPVYVIAFETNDDPRHDKWAIFARNWGTEGYCSQKDHQLYTANNVVRVFLPKKTLAPPMVQTSRMQVASRYPNTPSPRIDFIPGEGLVVSFSLQDPDAGAIAEMVLEVDWGAVRSARLPAGAPTAAASATAAPAATHENNALGTSIRARRVSGRSPAATAQRNAPIAMSGSPYLAGPFDSTRPMAVAPMPATHDSSRALMNRKEADALAAVQAACVQANDALPGVDPAKSKSICAEARKR